MPAFTWKDLQDAADMAGSVWVVDSEGGWRREGHAVMDSEDKLLEEHLTELGFTALRHRTVDRAGKPVRTPWVWRRLGEREWEYLVHVYVTRTTVEPVIALGLPAYLQLMWQLRQAGVSLS